MNMLDTNSKSETKTCKEDQKKLMKLKRISLVSAVCFSSVDEYLIVFFLIKK